jgi:hypothetical protein
MSLLVYAYTRGQDGQVQEVDELPDPPSSDLAGFEVTRMDLWGSDAVRALGLELLPTLREGDVYAEGDDLRRLAEEVATLRKSIAGVSAATEYSEVFIAARLDNIDAAIRIARRVGGGVYIG